MIPHKLIPFHIEQEYKKCIKLAKFFESKAREAPQGSSIEKHYLHVASMHSHTAAWWQQQAWSYKEGDNGDNR